MKTKLISLRGNAGSGKSTISQMLLEKLQAYDVLYLEQDNFRRHITNPKNDETFHSRRNEVTISSIKKMIEWGIENDFDYILLDGKFKAKHYGVLYDFALAKGIEILPYYFDISLEETLRRHSTREKAKFIPNSEMEDMYTVSDYLPQIKEKIIDEKMTKEEILAMILGDLKLD